VKNIKNKILRLNEKTPQANACGVSHIFMWVILILKSKTLTQSKKKFDLQDNG
jgi:hypothetical protein